MPGMGLGRLGAPGIIIKRKFRWTLEISTPCGNIPRHYVKVAARPSLDIEETEINFLNSTTWIPGKARWQPITVSYIDVPDNEMQGLYNWINTLYDFTSDATTRDNMSEKAGWAGSALLTMFDGCGTPLENWLLQSVWPQSINFGDLDYASSEEATIELTLRYSDVRYRAFCGPNPEPCCSGC